MNMWVLAPLLLFIMTGFFSWTTTMGAPWVPTSMGMVRKMLDSAEVGPEDLVYDLGCGDGRTIFTAVGCYGARVVGIEIDPLRFIWCQLLLPIYKLCH